ncbi:hypothetical protein [Streptomyces sp. NPDC058745]|uniref:hypothetical protein n=1 Tax=Streptomyces sp. NPDC058745 TaxID=3346621 RepID=UPI00367792DB
MSDVVCLGVLDACFIHGGFPADVLLAGCFDLVETFAFGGFAAKRDLLHDLGELVFEGACGGVGPFARPVRLAAAEDEAEAFGRGVVVAGDLDPGVLLGLGEFLLGGDVLGPVLFLEDEELSLSFARKRSFSFSRLLTRCSGSARDGFFAGGGGGRRSAVSGGAPLSPMGSKATILCRSPPHSEHRLPYDPADSGSAYVSCASISMRWPQ